MITVSVGGEEDGDACIGESAQVVVVEVEFREGGDGIKLVGELVVVELLLLVVFSSHTLLLFGFGRDF